MVCWSPDGKRIATSHSNALFIWDAETGEELAKLDDLQEVFGSIDWSPDGTRLAVGGNSLSIWDVDSQRVSMRLQTGSNVPHVRWGPQGVRIAFSKLISDDRGHSQIQKILCANRGYQSDAQDE